MLGQALWWSGIALETLLLVQGFRTKLLGRYRVFYAYVLFVWAQSLLRFSVYHLRPEFYVPTYWITEFFGLLIGCAVVFEIYRVGLSTYPGTARMARNALAFVFVLAFTKGIVVTWNNPHWWSFATTMDLERALRTVQAVAIATLVALFLFYAIPFGRNLRGVLLGYGLFIGESVIWLTFVSSGGEKFQRFWSYVHPATYFAVLGIWVVHLGSYSAAPEPKRAVQLEQQYQRIAATTNARLRDARGYLHRVVRP